MRGVWLVPVSLLPYLQFGAVAEPPQRRVLDLSGPCDLRVSGVLGKPVVRGLEMARR